MNKSNILEIVFEKARNDITQSVDEDIHSRRLIEKVDEVLATLSPREEKVVKMRFGLGSSKNLHSYKEISQFFGTSPKDIYRIEAKALRKLQHPIRSKVLSDYLKNTSDQLKSEAANTELTDVIETIKKLTPSLIVHLKKNSADLQKLYWKVFENLVAEFLLSQGFSQVHLVGQNPTTSADIFAVYSINSTGIEQRFFVEVKRWKDTLGIEEIQRVAGAMYLEKDIWGWSAAMIVAVGGYKDFNKISQHELKMKGILLKNKADVENWLKDYEFDKSGLYLSKDCKIEGLSNT